MLNWQTRNSPSSSADGRGRSILDLEALPICASAPGAGCRSPGDGDELAGQVTARGCLLPVPAEVLPTCAALTAVEVMGGPAGLAHRWPLTGALGAPSRAPRLLR